MNKELGKAETVLTFWLQNTYGGVSKEAKPTLEDTLLDFIEFRIGAGENKCVVRVRSESENTGMDGEVDSFALKCFLNTLLKALEGQGETNV